MDGSIKVTKLYGEEAVENHEKRLGIEKSAEVELDRFADEVIACDDRYSELLGNIGVGMDSDGVQQLHRLLDQAHDT